MSAATSPLGVGLYFIDVLACLLFCITLALAGARFGREASLEIELPELDASAAAGAVLSAPALSVRGAGDEAVIFFEGERVTLADLEARLRAATPLAVVVRSEESALSRVIAVAHAAGVADIQLAYEAARSGGDTP